MAQNQSDVVLRRGMHTQKIGDVTLLEAVATQVGEHQSVSLFFKSGTDPNHLTVKAGLEVTESRGISNAPMFVCRAQGSDDTVTIGVKDVAYPIKTLRPETELFRDLNVILAVRNQESVKITLQWLRYHVEHHGMEAALIVDRAIPGKNNKYFRQLRKNAEKIKGLKRLVVFESDVPLGKEDLPCETHPFNVPGAPGKDRMKIPKPAPWSSPMGEFIVFEIARARFLNAARAVANLELYDLLSPTKGGNIFDQACEATNGSIQLLGRSVYPWRVRKNDSGGFGDHICVQFDAQSPRRRWCVSPEKSGGQTVWRLVRTVGATPEDHEIGYFDRHMLLRHPADSVSKIVPKTSLIEDQGLIDQAQKIFDHKPVRMPEEKPIKALGALPRTAIVTTMKNEGPFILEWIAYHRAIGVQDFLIYTNDCTDGTDTMLQMLQEKGIVQHRDNPFKTSGLKPQHAALQAADDEPMIKNADWLICMDVDEFINIKCGDGRLSDLYEAVGDANMISITWRLFGNNNIHEFKDSLITKDYDHCAHELIRKPHQAWGFKTLFRNVGIFKKMGVHRPKGLKPQLWEEINWVNGSGAKMPKDMYRNGWRSTVKTYGYDLVQLNHYAVRCAESFLVKRDRGRVNHVDRDQGMAYWFRMNNNALPEHSISRMGQALQKELDALMADPDIAAAHAHSVKMHSNKIKDLKATEAYDTFYRELISPRLENLSMMHARFGANVFLMGPEVVPDEIAQKDPEEDFFFTVDAGETNH